LADKFPQGAISLPNFFAPGFIFIWHGQLALKWQRPD
jgi:hypothetical protein